MGTMMIQFFNEGEATEFDDETNNYGHANGKSSFVPVEFNSHPKASFKFGPKDFIEANGTRFWENSGIAAGRAVQRAILKTATELICAANIPTTGTDSSTALPFGDWNVLEAAGKLTKEKVAEDCRAACDLAEIDPAECVLLLNGRAYGEVLATLDAHAYGGTEAIRSGMIEGLYGFDAVMCNDSFKTGENLLGAIVPRSAIGVAARTIPIVNPAKFDEVGTITDEKSGLTIQLRRGGDWKTDSAVLTAEALFGAKLLQPTKIVRIVSAA